MLYLCLFCLNLLYKSLVVHNSGGGVVPNSDVYKYSDPSPYPLLARGAEEGQSVCSKRERVGRLDLPTPQNDQGIRIT